MRALKTADVFAALRIISSANIAEEVKLISDKVEEKEKQGKSLDVTDIGITIILTMLEKIVQSPSEKAFYKFLSGPLEIDEKEIEGMDPLDLYDKIYELKEVIDVERWKIFFGRVAKLLQNVN